MKRQLHDCRDHFRTRAVFLCYMDIYTYLFIYLCPWIRIFLCSGSGNLATPPNVVASSRSCVMAYTRRAASYLPTHPLLPGRPRQAPRASVCTEPLPV